MSVTYSSVLVKLVPPRLSAPPLIETVAPGGTSASQLDGRRSISPRKTEQSPEASPAWLEETPGRLVDSQVRLKRPCESASRTLLR